MHMSFRDARGASAVAPIFSVMPIRTAVSLQGRSEYVKLSAHVEHDDVQEAVNGDYCRGAKERYEWLRDVEYLVYGWLLVTEGIDRFVNQSSDCHVPETIAAPHTHDRR